ncbi:hypothetical protein B0T11DRAFT_230117 [Plectosphaerella cucumerina]|uniref:NmrA-like domain-containing protein n=1 Tax=Plectosphaerella cucumerina TaxID=40658 RepID=A0A8K0X2E1_9PEZI|nr:hypothetical protein B0T11DRAFT_230117 [Plectosphaerella cucumerina]
MVNVAVLGGSGHVGKTMVEALKSDPGHSVIVFSRQVLPLQSRSSLDIGVSFVVVDYNNVKSLKSLLEEHQINTVISCLGVHDEAVAQIELSMINASDQSTTTKRFIHSNWAVPNKPGSDKNAPWARFQLASQAHLRTTSLEATEIANGYFLDFWGMPYIHTHMMSIMPAMDIASKIAALPGTGNEPVSFTYSVDVARVVARMLHQPAGTWEETTYILGDKLTWHEFLTLAEDARGSKFDVSYDSEEALTKFQLTELPNHRAAYSFFPKEHLQWLYVKLELMMAQGLLNLPSEKDITKEFPDIKLLTAKEMLDQTWRGK